MMAKFYTALEGALRADATLVTLTGDNPPNDPRIVRGPVGVAARYPCLVFTDIQSVPAVFDAPTIQKDTVILLQAFSPSSDAGAGAIQIADRLEALLTARAKAQNVQYFDISNSTVKNNWTHWRSRGVLTLDEDRDVWEVATVADFSWHLSP